VENALRQVREKIEELDQELESFGKLGETIQRVRETRERHSEAHNTYLANLQVAQQYPRRRKALQKSEVAVNDLRDRLQELEQELEASRQGYDATEHAGIREKEDSFKQELTEKTTRQAERRDRLEALITEIEGLEALAEERDQKRLAMERVEGLKRIVGTVRSLLREAGPHVTRHLVHRISVEASNLYAEIMGSHRGRLHWSVDYELSLEVRGRRRTFRQFSGGEQMGAALALRLALLHEILPIDVAFFDEPTAHLDPARRDGLAEKIMQVKGFSQLFVISHDDTFERAAQNYVRIVKDDNGSHLEEA
jgi:exonuclease SbcC